jgi:hypothetical protein
MIWRAGERRWLVAHELPVLVPGWTWWWWRQWCLLLSHHSLLAYLLPHFLPLLAHLLTLLPHLRLHILHRVRHLLQHLHLSATTRSVRAGGGLGGFISACCCLSTLRLNGLEGRSILPPFSGIDHLS